MTHRLTCLALFLLMSANFGCFSGYEDARISEAIANVEKIILADGDSYVTTDHMIKISISYRADGWPKDFDVLVGPDSEVEFERTTGRLYVIRGWAYVFGHWPRVRTNRLSAGADGSALLVWVDTATPPNQRVFFIEGSAAWADVIDPPGEHEDWYDHGKFAVLAPSDQIDIVSLPADPTDPIRILYDEALARAEAAGYYSP